MKESKKEREKLFSKKKNKIVWKNKEGVKRKKEYYILRVYASYMI